MAQDHAAHRLPRTVEPRRYELTLWPDLEAFSFTGEERALVRVLEPVTEVVLNAVGLEVRSATMEREGTEPVEAAVSYEPGDERVRLNLPRALDPGDWTLHLAFAGQITDELRGFYRSTFRDIDGRERVLGTTQFEATDARRAFPCWDEPDRKATFALTLVIDRALTAVSNTSVAAEADEDGGRKKVRFAETIPMSSYLVAFVIGPLEATAPVEVDGVPLRVVHVPGKGGLTSFALEAATHALGFFAEWPSPTRATSSTTSPSPTSPSAPWRTWAASPTASRCSSSTRPRPPRWSASGWPRSWPTRRPTCGSATW